jgi:hypothetical protein
MDSRRLVVWISTGILGFQGATLAFDLLNCTALSWLYVRMHGLPAVERRVDETPSSSDADFSEQSIAVFCKHPQGRIDAAVNQGLSVLAGLALGSSVTGRGDGEP